MKTTFFDEVRTATRKSISELKSLYGLQPTRDLWSGNVTNDGTDYILTSADGVPATLSIAERGPYPPGRVLEPGQAVRPETVPTGGQGGRWGYFDFNDGWFFLIIASGLYTVVRRAGVDSEPRLFGGWDGEDIVQAQYARKFRFRPQDGYIYHTPFSWYGFGPTEFEFQVKEKRADSDWFRSIASYRPANETSVTQPHLFLRAESFSGPGDDPFVLRVTGRQISIIGDYDPPFRKTAIETTTAGIAADAWYPVISVRREAIYPYALSQLLSIEPVLTTTMRLALVEDTPFTTGYVPIPEYGTNQTLLEYRVPLPGEQVASLAGVGNLLDKFIISGGAGGRSAPTGDPRPIDRQPLIEQRPFTLYARLQPGAAGTESLFMTTTFREDF